MYNEINTFQNKNKNIQNDFTILNRMLKGYYI